MVLISLSKQNYLESQTFLPVFNFFNMPVVYTKSNKCFLIQIMPLEQNIWII